MKNLLFALIVLFIGTSCSPQLNYFTKEMYDTNGFSEQELREIQFFLSQDLILNREVTGGSSEIISGKIKMVNGRKIEEITIRKGTPGVALFQPKYDRIAVSFEDNGDNRFLVFGPNPKAGDRFVLLAKSWNRRNGEVTYDNQTFTVDANDAYAALMVDVRRLNKVSVSKRTAQGRRIK